MGKYAVVNPATGETVKEYPDISDDELEAAIAAADEAHRNWGLETSVAERAALVKKVADFHTERRRAAGRDRRARDGQADGAGAGRGRLLRRHLRLLRRQRAEEFLADEPIDLLAGDGTALVRKFVGRPARGDHAVELPLLPGGPFRRPESGGRQHGPAEARGTSAPSRPRRSSR